MPPKPILIPVNCKVHTLSSGRAFWSKAKGLGFRVSGILLETQHLMKNKLEPC